jgi:Mor family transcriptional regulator
MQMMKRNVHQAALSWIIAFTLLLFLTGCWAVISKEAKEKFNSRQGPFSVTIYPIHVIKGKSVEHDQKLSKKLADFLKEENLANPLVSDDQIDVPIQWGRNQAKMLQKSAETFSQEVSKAGIETEYALLAEILCNKDENWVGGVHFYLADQNGLIASARLSNSHWSEFKEVNPKDRYGGYKVLISMLQNAWGRI